MPVTGAGAANEEHSEYPNRGKGKVIKHSLDLTLTLTLTLTATETGTFLVLLCHGGGDVGRQRDLP